MEIPDNCILVIFGASGDLTKRKLIPAVFDLYQQNLLPDRFAVLGVSRTNFDDQSFRKQMLKDVDEFCQKQPVEKDALKKFIDMLHYHCLDTKEPSEYSGLKERQSLSKRRGRRGAMGWRVCPF